MSRLNLLVVAILFCLTVPASTFASTTPQPGFTTQFFGGIGDDESQAGVPFPIGAPPCTTSTCSTGIELGDIVLCDGPASACGATVAGGVVTGYTGPVSDIVALRADPTNPNGITVTVYSDLIGDTTPPEGDGADVFVNPPAPPTSNFVIIAEGAFSHCPRPNYGPNCEDTIYIPFSGSTQSDVSWDIVSDTSLPPPTTTPEPGTLLLVGTTAVAVSLRRRWRNS